MDIRVIEEKKKRFLDLLLLADEQEDMIDRYLEFGTMFALYDGEVKAVCVVTEEGDGVVEIKNIATDPGSQRKGYGRALVEHVVERYRNTHSLLQVGTGDSPLTVPFYEACGFVRSHIVKNFFIDYYDHPIFECGKQLVDMVYFKRTLS